MDRGDIWTVNLEPTKGHEQAGSRPVLIISAKAFNMLTGVPIVLPITNGGNFARTAGFAVPLDGTTTSVSGVVRCDQPRALDLRARGGRHIDSVPDFILEDVIARVSAILE